MSETAAPPCTSAQDATERFTLCAPPPEGGFDCRATLPPPLLPAAAAIEHARASGRGEGASTSAPRAYVHAHGLWHRSVHVWLVDAVRGTVLLQQRSVSKDTWPGLWDISAAGHIEAGQDSLETAYRELGEELGVPPARADLGGRKAFTCPEEFAPLGGCNAYADVYLASVDSDVVELRLGQAEVSGARWEPAAALLDKLRAKLEQVQAASGRGGAEKGALADGTEGASTGAGVDVVPRSAEYIELFREELRARGVGGV